MIEKKVQLALMVMAFALMISDEPVSSQGLGMSRYGTATDAAYGYCSDHGGYPADGKCYFPDGGYCDALAYYYGTCPTRTNREQSMWEAEVYAFLHEDEGYPVYHPYTYGVPVGSYISQSYSNIAYWQNAGDQFYLKGDYEQAAAMYTKVVRIDPLQKGAWINLGNAFYFLGSYQESLNAFETALKIDPQNVQAWQGKGMDLSALNQIAEANVALAKAKNLQGQ
jgi:tetratricopeptide (TPR) repeat protein